METRFKTGLAAGGGGNKGGVMIATLQRLHEVKRLAIDIISGTSTGALYQALCAVNEYPLVDSAYTSVDNAGIYSGIAPFGKKGNIRIPALLLRQYTGKLTGGDSENLKKLIPKFYSKNLYNLLKERGIEMIVSRTEIREKPYRLERVSSLDSSWEDMCDALHDSSNAPPFLTMRREIKNGQERELTDGGLVENVPIIPLVAPKRQVKEIWACICRHRPEENQYRGNTKDFLHHAQRIAGIALDRQEELSLALSLEYAERAGVKVNIIWLPKEIQGSSLYFDPKQIKEWSETGYRTALDLDRHQTGEEWLKYFRAKEGIEF